ncbi:VWA domain-containing protein [Cytobacillus suaedae]|nr:VWA domain-containing protein [Cytobacillus suaedae]
MNNNLTEIIFLLDRSGSMSGLESDTIGGFNAFIEQQKVVKGETIVTTVLFDDKYELLWNGVDANEVKLTDNDYFVRGSTALLDAVGKSILDVGIRLSNTKEARRPGQVLFVITTDGYENASREFSYEKVRNLINHQKAKYNWEFIFMGANIDAAKEADNLGIDRDDVFSFEASSKGVEVMYNVANESIMEKRSRRYDLRF